MRLTDMTTRQRIAVLDFACLLLLVALLVAVFAR